jgi:hypothetical protein
MQRIGRKFQPLKFMNSVDGAEITSFILTDGSRPHLHMTALHGQASYKHFLVFNWNLNMRALYGVTSPFCK